MNHADIETLAKNWVVDAADRPANPRVQQVVLRLLGDLCKAIEDLDISPTEFWHGVSYMSAAGAAGELGLLAAGLGLERFLDIRADEAEQKAGLEGGTPRTIEGPLYVAGAPESVGFARLDDGSEEDKGEVLFMQGTVFDQDGKPMPGAKVEVWHANLLGNYSFFDQTQSPFNLRRSIVTDDQGRYQFRSIIPVGYGCPPDGTTQALLNQLGRHGQRPAHIHFFVSAPGHRKLTTQINIDGDEYLWDDFAFASREGLVPPIARIDDPAQLDAKRVAKPFASIDFDFRLYRETEAAPSTLVDRVRAAA
ncbi:mRNA 3'-end processing factor [Massilia sp. WF1]|uniref:catechol 1,2-dioxygenase n=1 Tax=unclassified Massilia TaxID=2609279 RepID=UPI00068AF910|nr:MULTISPECIES: catechol 1,2-dioxygenase [unclassified Massilia]ALK97585.1 catechol 1,2-dioxygenase [Massilia sp. WG5]KNZ67835.1 mRNA 3'-end processing factor [Massilia sp. WF1]